MSLKRSAVKLISCCGSARVVFSRAFRFPLAVLFHLLLSHSLQGQKVAEELAKPPPTFLECYSLPARDPIFNQEKTYEVTVEFVWVEKNLIVISDGTETAVLNFKRGRNTEDYEVGDRLQISGLLRKRSAHYLKFICKKAVEIGRGELAPLKELPEVPTRKKLRSFNLERVHLSGRILNISQISNVIQILIQGRGYQYSIETTAVENEEIFSQVGRNIHTEGLFFFPFEAHTVDTAYDMPRVFLPNLENIQITGKPRLQIDHIRGETVELLDDGRIFIQEAVKPQLTQLKVFFRSDFFAEGQLLECWGHSSEKAGEKNYFTVSAVRMLDADYSSQRLNPLPLTPYSAGGADQHLQRVIVVGERVGDSRTELQSGYFTLKPDNGSKNIRVILPGSVSLADQKVLDAHRIQVTGYLRNGQKNAKIFPHHLSEIEVLGKKPWVESAAFRWLALGLLAVVLGGLAWVVSLRRLVKNRTEALDNSLGLLNASYDAVHEGICVIDSEGAVRKTNPRFWEMLGLNECDPGSLSGDELGARISQCSEAPEEFQSLWTKLSRDREVREEGDLKMVCCTEGEFRFYTVPAVTSKDQRELGRVWVFKDMTEQRRLESSLVQSQKMEAVGRLAGGVAHDFNNLLTGILGNLNVARLDPALPVRQIEEPLEAAEQAGRRATKLIKSLLTFSRREKLSSSPNCANAVVRQLASLIRPTLRGKVTLRVDLAKDLRLAEFDPTQLEQVILNMVVNASDEIGSNDGEIGISTQAVTVTNPDTHLTGRYVCISVTDNGGGMPESVRSQIFEPFFTTKDPGKGTGLGLATAYGIITQMRGWIDCESKLGEGTVFRIYLSELEASSHRARPIEVESSSQGFTRLEREQIEILCVDDEPVVREITEGVVKRAGFRTANAQHGRDALDLLAKREANGEPLPDVIVTDLTMPVMDGKELLREVRLAYPDMLFIICSGYFVDCEQFMEGTETRLDGFIQKPYEPNRMVEEIERLLAERKLSLIA